jgi:hypothetical protein
MLPFILLRTPLAFVPGSGRERRLIEFAIIATSAAMLIRNPWLVELFGFDSGDSRARSTQHSF